MIRIHFDRAAGTAHVVGPDPFDATPCAAGQAHTDVALKLCWEMTGCGMPDAPAEFFDERNMHCFTVGSYRAAAHKWANSDAWKAKLAARKARS